MRISVVIPTYNRAAFVRAAVESCLAQTHKPFEVIVVDDGSTDGTRESLASFGTGRGILYVFQENQERSVARNNGIARATGELIAFLDSDDRWKPNHLANLVGRLLSVPEAACVYSAREIIDQSGVTMATRGKGEGDLFRPMILSETFVHPSASAVRRSRIQESGGFNPLLRVGEDWDFFLRIAARWPIAFSPEPTEIESYHPDKTMLNVSLVVEQRPLALAAALTDPVVAERSRSLLRSVRSRLELLSATDLMVAGQMSESRKRLVASLALDWRTVFDRRVLTTGGRALLGARGSRLLGAAARTLRRRKVASR